jgi:hypothetical protein
MNINIPYTIFVSIAPAVLLVVPVYLVFHLFKRTTRHRKSPLNIELLRSPGQSLREEITELSIDITGELLLIPILVLALYAIAVTYLLISPEKASSLMVCLYIFVAIGVSIYQGIKVYRMFKRRNVMRLGYECELAVGQDLSELVRYGFKVYNDFPADGFNIDHIAIGPSGVFAIETKGRSKQVDVEKENWKLTFDGEILRFPGWTEREPIKQAKSQAKWLSKWIESATGERQNVVPVLAIPGWFITRPKKSTLRVYNGKGSNYLAKGQQVLSENRIKAISHQVEDKCRDVKPGSYKKD